MCASEDCLKHLKLVTVNKVPCDDFLLMGIKYQHIDPPSPDVDYIAIRLDLKDTRSGSIYQVIWEPNLTVLERIYSNSSVFHKHFKYMRIIHIYFLCSKVVRGLNMMFL